MKTVPPMITVDFFTFCELHQLWQAVILKPLKLEECILHFWKSPIFINVVPTSQGHSCVLNTKKSILKIAGFITVSLLGVYILFSTTVTQNYEINTSFEKTWMLYVPASLISFGSMYELDSIDTVLVMEGFSVK